MTRRLVQKGTSFVSRNCWRGFLSTFIAAMLCAADESGAQRATPNKAPDDAKTTKPAPAKLREPPATPAERIKIVKDFKVELLYSVPKDKEGSWVNMCVDPKGR